MSLQPAAGSFASVTIGDIHGDLLWVDPTRAKILHGQPLDYVSVQQVLRAGKPPVVAGTSYQDPAVSSACFAVPRHDPRGQPSSDVVDRP
ncbi:MAG TPA: hypothetical protein VNE17_02345 [Nitrolancea sp.]|nr:hypothetical protein [Nitrolancea sp.]